MPRGSPALVAAIAAAALIDPCPACKAPESQGLCHSDHCRRQVLPQIKQSSLQRDAHSGMYYEAQIDKLEADSAVEAAKRRNERKREKAIHNIALALDGQASDRRARNRQRRAA